MGIAKPLNERTGLITLPKRQKIQGRKTKVFVGIPPFGTRLRLQPQALVANAFRSTVTVGGTPAAGNYVLTIGPVSYTVVASVSDTNDTIRNAFVELINAATDGYRAGNGSGSTFVLMSDVTFATPTGTAPTGASLTASAVTAGAATAKGATTITLSNPNQSEMQVGQFLTFRTQEDQEFMVELTSKATVGATSLSVRELQEEIPAGAIAEFPAYLADLTDAAITRSFTRAAAEDYNTGVVASGVITGGESTMSLPGNFAYNNAGAATLLYAARNTLEVFIERRFDPPSVAYKTGRIEWGYAVVTDASDAPPNDSFVTQGFEVAFNAEITEIAPVGV